MSNRVTVLTARVLSGVCTALVATVVVTGCSSPDDDPAATQSSQVDTTSAPQARWSNYAGIQVPKGKDGPATTDPVRYGYAHTPQGAVLAAINTQAQMALASEDNYPKVSQHCLVPSRGRDQWVQGRSLAEVHGELDGELAAQFTGFRIEDYTDDSAIVVLAADYPQVGLMAYPVQVNWIGGDWRVTPAPQDAGVAPVGIDDLTEFTEFSAQHSSSDSAADDKDPA